VCASRKKREKEMAEREEKVYEKKLICIPERMSKSRSRRREGAVYVHMSSIYCHKVVEDFRRKRDCCCVA